jgi:formamidopyrimidine-DNA glycosylase
MPELPEVETVARDLNERLVGLTILGVKVHFEGSLDTASREDFSQALTGRRILGVGRRGKYIIVKLSDEQAMLVHLRMTGQLLVRDKSDIPDKHVHLAYDLEDGCRLWFRDVRKFGRVYLAQDPDEVTNKLGPEPLDPDFTEGAFCARLTRHRGMLKPLLLDQRFLAGLGNIYVDESLFQASLRPRRRVDTLAEDDPPRLYRAIRRVLSEAIANRGTSLSDYVDSRGEPGRNQEHLAVFRRAGGPCPRCGTPIQRDRVGGRGTFYCPTCQE